MQLTLEIECEEDGRWLAEVPELPGALAYGSTSVEAMSRAEVLALRILAERIEHGEAAPIPINFVLPAAA
jgi:predicted RNase H-like HicB family nuclease